MPIVPVPIGRLFLELLKKQSGSYEEKLKIIMGIFAPDQRVQRIIKGYSPAWVRSAIQEDVKRLTRTRLRVPLYIGNKYYTNTMRVIVPGQAMFDYENQVPMAMPEIAIRPSTRLPRRITTTGRPPYYLDIHRPSPNEHNRKRRDTKVPGQYKKALAIINRTYGPYTEWLELQQAFSDNFPNLHDVAGALAINQAVDYAYGTRAKILKEKVYSSRYYNLPVGIDAIMSTYNRIL